jgi:hypothetical protein
MFVGVQKFAWLLMASAVKSLADQLAAVQLKQSQRSATGTTTSSTTPTAARVTTVNDEKNGDTAMAAIHERVGIHVDHWSLHSPSI